MYIYIDPETDEEKHRKQREHDGKMIAMYEFEKEKERKRREEKCDT